MLTNENKIRMVEIWFLCIIGTKEPTTEEIEFYNAHLPFMKEHIIAQLEHSKMEYEQWINQQPLD
jgi:hypothetical protein